MRATVALVIASAIAIAAAVYAVAREEPSAARVGAVTLVGDSLNVGTEPYLRGELYGWSIEAHDRVGRATAEGVEELRSLGSTLAPVVVVSLGTNDPDGSEGAFRALVDAALEYAGPARCVIWATIVRDGEPRTAFNDVLGDAASTHGALRLVDWAELVENDSTLLAGDRVHGSPSGYARRAQAIASAARACVE
jgi:lysophospholipase L1-like esterase